MQTPIYTYDNKTLTLQQWSTLLNVPVGTLSRRMCEGLSPDKVFHSGKLPKNKPPVEVGRTGMTKEKATAIRQAYKDGGRGKALYEAVGLTKNQYTELIANRTWSDAKAWWKDDTQES